MLRCARDGDRAPSARARSVRTPRSGLARAGLDGLEIFHPDRVPSQREAFLRQADALGLDCPPRAATSMALG